MIEKVLLATPEQKAALEGTYENGSVLAFVEDANGNWVVNNNVINDANFESVKEQLGNLPRIEYVPPIFFFPPIK